MAISTITVMLKRAARANKFQIFKDMAKNFKDGNSEEAARLRLSVYAFALIQL